MLSRDRSRVPSLPRARPAVHPLRRFGAPSARQAPTREPKPDCRHAAASLSKSVASPDTYLEASHSERLKLHTLMEVVFIAYLLYLVGFRVIGRY